MKLQYRLKEINFVGASSVYIAQYKLWGIWFNINYRQTGRLFISPSITCETKEEALKRINVHRKNVKRVISWRFGKIVSYDYNV